jgi:hypothetical protein
VVVRAVAQRHGRGPRRWPARVRGIDAILGGHTHDGVPVAGAGARTPAARRSSPTPAATASSWACWTSRSSAGKVSGLPLPAAAGVRQHAAGRRRDAGADRPQSRAPYAGQAGREAGGDRRRCCTGAATSTAAGTSCCSTR